MSVAVSALGLAPTWPRRRRFNGCGLAVAVLIHLLILAAVLTWRSRVSQSKPQSIELSVIQAKKDQSKPEPPLLAPKPEFQSPKMQPIPELPPIAVEIPSPPAPVAPAVTVVAAPAPAPGAVGVPTGTGTGSAVPPAPAGSAVGSPRLAEACPDAPDRMMVADVYRLSSRATSVEEMDRRKPVGTICLTQLDIAPRHMGLGLPGMDFSEWYGLDIRFTINMPQDAERDFVLLCDDGGVLYVDDKEVLNADGLHGTDAVMGTVSLTKGVHHVRVRYFQGPGDGALMLGWKKAGAPVSETKPIPRRLLGRPGPVVAASL